MSDEDEEGVEINKIYKEYKTKMKAEQLEHLDDVMLDDGPTIGSSNKVGEENDGNGIAYEALTCIILLMRLAVMVK